MKPIHEGVNARLYCFNGNIFRNPVNAFYGAPQAKFPTVVRGATK